MTGSVFDLQQLFPASEADLRVRFESAMPYPHALLPNSLNADFSCRLVERLESLSYRWRRVTESFYEHEVCNLLQLSAFVGGELEELVRALREPTLVSRLCGFVGTPPAAFLSLTGHRLYGGDRIETHNDNSASGETFRLLMFVDPHPAFSGGELLLQEKVAGETVTRVRVPYVPFQAYLFRFGPHCYHAVSPVDTPVSGANRLTLLATYGNEVDS